MYSCLSLTACFIVQLFNYTFKHVEEQYGHEAMKNRIDRFFTRVSCVCVCVCVYVCVCAVLCSAYMRVSACLSICPRVCIYNSRNWFICELFAVYIDNGRGQVGYFYTLQRFSILTWFPTY